MICACPACQSSDIDIFYSHQNAPVHSVLVHHSREEALSLATGEIRLGFCKQCGFIFNTTFDSSLQDYFLEYESTQGFSPTFNRFSENLARRLVDRYNLHGKDVIEIGCGQGEFLKVLCEMGDNRGLGFDPAYVEGRVEVQNGKGVQFIKDYYSEKYTDRSADFVICKMTLEHILPVYDFVSTVRRSIGDRPATTVFFQIPEVTRILDETAFWDVYYEHCSYFSAGSLARLFRRAGFDVLDLATAYDSQYLMIEARPGTHPLLPALPQEETPEQLYEHVEAFRKRVTGTVQGWHETIQRLAHEGKRTILWGGGSKAVAFITALGSPEGIAYAVDINPYKNLSYMAGSGIEIRLPDGMHSDPPGAVILMNPIYEPEVRQILAGSGYQPEIYPVGK